MAKQAKARLDVKGVSSLGIDKLVEILLQEASSNKPLKARLMAALAGASGPDDIARLVDKRLDAISTARSGITSNRARDLAAELSGLLRTIEAELASADQKAAFERLMKLLGMKASIEKRLYAPSAKLQKVFRDVETAIVTLVPSLPQAVQLQAVPRIEAQRRKDRYGESLDFYAQLSAGLLPPAIEAWKAALREQLKVVDPAQNAGRLLQRIAVATGDVDMFLAVEQTKTKDRQDIFSTARLLHEAGRFAEALEWIRKPVPQMRIIQFEGISACVDPDFQSNERKLLEAEILIALKDRKAAQKVRWDLFAATFDPAALRAYLAALGDFEEFDELDKAFALAMGSKDIETALAFLLEWPRHDIAARHVIAHAAKWDGADYELLVPAAGALQEEHPLAATILYRVLLKHILDRSLSSAYPHASIYLDTLGRIWPAIGDPGGMEDHDTFLRNLQVKHGRKYGFWSLVPKELLSPAAQRSQ